MNNLDSELLILIFNNLDPKDLYNIEKTCIKFNKILNDNYFNSLYPFIELKSVKKPEEKLRIASKYNKLDLAKKYLIICSKIDDALYEGCKSGNEKVVNMILDFIFNNNNSSLFDWSFGLHGSIISGNIKLVNYFVNDDYLFTDYDYSLALRYASETGILDIVKLILPKTRYYIHWSIELAMEKGYNDIYEYLINNS